jgi:magnesium-protoporphyrin IX monomethyl ester (oxidative) cyclase
LLVGFPHEPEEVYRKYCKDLPLLVHLQPPTGAYPVRFDRFSPYHMQAREYGLKLKPCEFYEMLYPFPPAELDDLAYFFVDADFSARYAATTALWLGKLRERVAHWQIRWGQRDRRLKPELTVRQTHGTPLVYDSRSGAAIEHALSPTGWRVLEALEEQHRLPRLVEKIDGVPEAEIAAEIAELRRRGLLFEEDGLYLSLVLRSEDHPALAAQPRAQAVGQVSFA